MNLSFEIVQHKEGFEILYTIFNQPRHHYQLAV